MNPEPKPTDGREVAVIGLGRSGVAATRLLLRSRRQVYSSDAGRFPALEELAEGLRVLGASVDIGGHDLERIAKASLCVVSPGVPRTAPPIAAAARAGVPIRAEADLGLEALAGVSYIAVTGTNGKTTVTALIGQLLSAAGRRAEAVGNIGKPLSEIALEDHRPDWLAVELSSFQLHDMETVRPLVGVLTNLAPDHLDRYATLAEYYADKRRLFQHAGPGSIWVANGDDPASREMMAGIPGRHLTFSTTRRADGWYDRDADVLRLGDEMLMPRKDLLLLGDHNVANALAAALAVEATGVGMRDIARGLRSFRALEHRMEPVAETKGVLWINDSKATNIASTEVAIAAMARPFVLLLGGRHKGEPYTKLGSLQEHHCRAVVAYGEAREIILKDLAESGVPVIPAGAFEEVMAKARDLARPGDAVLLSPACSSYDMFKNYEERGRRFREIILGW